MRHYEIEHSCRRIEVGKRRIFYIVGTNDRQPIGARVKIFQLFRQVFETEVNKASNAAFRYGNGIFRIFRAECRLARRYGRCIERAVNPTSDRGRRDPCVRHVLHDVKGDISGQLGEIIRSVDVRHKPIAVHLAAQQILLRRGDIRKGYVLVRQCLPVGRLHLALINVIYNLLTFGKEFRIACNKVAFRRVGVILPTRHAGRSFPVVVCLRHVEGRKVEIKGSKIESRLNFRYAVGKNIGVQTRIIFGIFHCGKQVICAVYVCGKIFQNCRNGIVDQTVVVEREPDQTRQRFFICVEHGEFDLQARKIGYVQIERRARNQIFRFVVLSPIPTHHVGRSRPAVCRLADDDEVARRFRRRKSYYIAVFIIRYRAVKTVCIGFQRIEDRRNGITDSALFVYGKFENVVRRHVAVRNDLAVFADKAHAFFFDTEHNRRIPETKGRRNAVDTCIKPVERPRRNLRRNRPGIRCRQNFEGQRSNVAFDLHVVGHILLRPTR